ncbi:hypothetical protein SprV_1002908000 [Sparganum proliferum]
MGIFATLKQSKDPTVLRALNGYLRFNTKLVEAKVLAKFIGECIERNEYPNHYWRALRRSHTVLTTETLKRYAENQLESTLVKIEELKRHVCQRTAVLDTLTDDERQEFDSYTQSIGRKRGEAKSSALLRSVHERKPQSRFPKDPSRYVHNHSYMMLDKTSLEALSLGPKFCIPRRKVNQLELETQFENLWNQTYDLVPASTDSIQHFKSTLVNCSYQYLNKGPKSQGLLTKAHVEKLKELRENKDILVTRPDKGTGVVIMNRSDYVAKIQAILSDEKKFRKGDKEKDCTEEVETKLTDCLRRLHTGGHISDRDLEQLRSVGTHIPRLYGLPKIHKEGLPVRPILDMRNSPYHAIARWLAEKLKPVQRQLAPRSYRDTFEFIDDIKDLNVNGMVMFSLDVSSLFTNVPVTETVDYLCDFLSASQQEIGIPTNTLKELLLRCTLNVQFLFDNQLYRQVDGVAMGSPLGPLLADVFMGKLERFQLSEQIDKLKHYGRYVHDIFAIATAETDVATLLDAANQAHPSIKFTLEMETAGSLPFLDVLLSRRPDGSVRRSVYRKKTWSGQYTNFASFVPLQQKRNLVRCLAQRARRICSTDSIEEELRKIQDFLRENGYPERFIEKNIAERPIKPATPTAEKKTLFLKVPFQGDAASELLRRRLDQAVSRTFPAARVQIAFSTNPILRGEGKDKLPPQTTSMCIYSFTCSCGAGYIGRTSRRLSKRIREHLPAWLAKGETRRIDSAILAHVVDSGHRVDPNEAFRVIYKVPSSYPKLLGQRLLATAEAAAIRLRKPILCAQKNHVQAPRLQWSKVD